MSAISWIKIETSSFDNNKIRLINKMPQGDMILCTWFRLLIEAGKNNDNGYVYVDKDIPYTYEMLGRLFDRSVKKIKMALDTLRNFKLIDIDDNDFIKIINWDKHQNVEKMNLIKEAEEEKLNRIRMQGRERAARYRERKRVNKENSLKDEVEQYFKEDDKSLDTREEQVKDKVEKEMSIYDGEAVKNDEGEKTLNNENVILENNDLSINKAAIKNDSDTDKHKGNVIVNENNVMITESNVTVTDKNKIRNRIRDREETDSNIEKKKGVSVSNVTENDNVTESNALSLKSDGSVMDSKSYKSVSNYESDDNSSISNKQDYDSLKNISVDNKKKDRDVNKLDNYYGKKNYYKLTEDEEEAVSILRNYEKVSGRCGWIDYSVVKLLIKDYEKKYVEMAFDRAVNAKKFKMNYICGILRNWEKYGYPKEGEDFFNGRGNKLGFGADKEKFKGIKKQCRSELTDNEWTELEKELI